MKLDCQKGDIECVKKNRQGPFVTRNFTIMGEKYNLFYFGKTKGQYGVGFLI